MGDVIVVALTTKQISTAREETIRTNRSPAVGALGHGALVARCHLNTAHRCVSNLAARHFDRLPNKLIRNSAIWNRFAVLLLLEQFVTSYHLGVARIFNFVPGADGVVRKIRCGFVLGHDTF